MGVDVADERLFMKTQRPSAEILCAPGRHLRVNLLGAATRRQTGSGLIAAKGTAKLTTGNRNCSPAQASATCSR